MLMGDALVVKLPAGRVAELIASGVGGPFGTGQRRPMNEWVTIPDTHGAQWEGLAREAFDFVARAAGSADPGARG